MEKVTVVHGVRREKYDIDFSVFSLCSFNIFTKNFLKMWESFIFTGDLSHKTNEIFGKTLIFPKKILLWKILQEAKQSMVSEKQRRYIQRHF